MTSAAVSPSKRVELSPTLSPREGWGTRQKMTTVTIAINSGGMRTHAVPNIFRKPTLHWGWWGAKTVSLIPTFEIAHEVMFHNDVVVTQSNNLWTD
jgi:hypothetical protein